MIFNEGRIVLAPKVMRYMSELWKSDGGPAPEQERHE